MNALLASLASIVAVLLLVFGVRGFYFEFVLFRKTSEKDWFMPSDNAGVLSYRKSEWRVSVATKVLKNTQGELVQALVYECVTPNGSVFGEFNCIEPAKAAVKEAAHTINSKSF